MTDPGGPSDSGPDEPYLPERLRDLLAHHPDVNELELEVVVAGNRVVVTGVVQTEARRAAISEVLATACPTHVIQNETSVLPPTRVREEESLE